MAKPQRRSPRLECAGTAGVQVVVLDAPRPARVVNLSVGGCLLVLKEPQFLSQDTILELTFRINDLQFRVWGQVRAIRSGTQIGFQFSLLSDRVRRRLEDLIAQLIEDFITRGALRGASEKRRNTRIGCTGSAGIQMPAGEAFYPARIVNLSAGGCLLVLQKPQRLSQDTMVELTFQINDLPFRVRGRVRSIRSETKIGFEFPQLSKRVRRQLEYVVDELIGNLVRRFAERKEFT